MFIPFSCTILRDRLITDIWCCDSHRHISYMILTCIHLILAMLYLTLDIWHQYLPCYIWHLISDTSTCHAILDTWYLTPVLAMLYLTLDIWHRYLPCYTWPLISDSGTWHAITHLTCYHLVLVHLTWYCDTWLVTVIRGTCIILHIHDYHFYGDLAWLLYCYQTSDTLEFLYSWTLYSWTPLNSCIPEPL